MFHACLLILYIPLEVFLKKLSFLHDTDVAIDEEAFDSISTSRPPSQMPARAVLIRSACDGSRAASRIVVPDAAHRIQGSMRIAAIHLARIRQQYLLSRPLRTQARHHSCDIIRPGIGFVPLLEVSHEIRIRSKMIDSFLVIRAWILEDF